MEMVGQLPLGQADNLVPFTLLFIYSAFTQSSDCEL